MIGSPVASWARIRPLLVGVVRVEGPQLGARLDFRHARADELAADAMPDEGFLDLPAIALAVLIPFVTAEVERLQRHLVSRLQRVVVMSSGTLTGEAAALGSPTRN
jgi:hypothetical protein